MIDVQTIKELIAVHRERSRRENAETEKYKRWYRSEFWDDTMGDDEVALTLPSEEGDPPVTESNFPYPFVDTITASIVPTNPQITVRARKKAFEPAARLRQALVNDCWKRVKLHQKLWKATSHAVVAPRSFFKAVWREDLKSPWFRVLESKFVFFDMDAEDWDDIRYICEVTVKTRDEVNAIIAKKGKEGYDAKMVEKIAFDKYPAWLKDKVSDGSGGDPAAREVFHWAVIYEFYDLRNMKFYHIHESCPEPLFEGELPIRKMKNPFMILSFNDNLDNLGGLSDIKLIAPSLEQLNEIDSLQLGHTRLSLPDTMVNGNAFENPEEAISVLRKSPGGGIIDARLRPEFALQNALGVRPTPQLSPDFERMAAKESKKIEYVLGTPAFTRGQVGGTDLATEAALADTAFRNRNGHRMKQIFDVLTWAAQCVIALYEQNLPNDAQIYVRVVGDNEFLQADRATLGMPVMRDDPGGNPLDYDYEVTPYSPSENSRLVQLKLIRENAQILLNNPGIDQRGLLVFLLDLLQLPPDLITKQQPNANVGGDTAGELPEPTPTAGATGDAPEGGGMPASTAAPTLPTGTTGGPGVGTSPNAAIAAKRQEMKATGGA